MGKNRKNVKTQSFQYRGNIEKLKVSSTGENLKNPKSPVQSEKVKISKSTVQEGKNVKKYEKLKVSSTGETCEKT